MTPILSKTRVEIEKTLKDLITLIKEVPKEQREKVYGGEIKELDSIAEAFVGGNRILYKQIKRIMEE